MGPPSVSSELMVQSAPDVSTPSANSVWTMTLADLRLQAGHVVVVDGERLPGSVPTPTPRNATKERHVDKGRSARGRGGADRPRRPGDRSQRGTECRSSRRPAEAADGSLDMDAGCRRQHRPARSHARGRGEQRGRLRHSDRSSRSNRPRSRRRRRRAHPRGSVARPRLQPAGRAATDDIANRTFTTRLFALARPRRARYRPRRGGGGVRPGPGRRERLAAVDEDPAGPAGLHGRPGRVTLGITPEALATFFQASL